MKLWKKLNKSAPSIQNIKVILILSPTSKRPGLFYADIACAIISIMIASVEGRVALKGERFAIIEVGGLGYKIFTIPQVLKKLKKGNKHKLFTYLYQRETAIELYGFLTMAEVEVFEILNQVSGIGPKSALGVLAVAPIDTLKKAISAGEIGYLTRVSGIGRKTAEKIVIELREKFGKAVETSQFKDEEDVFEGLKALGYSNKEIRDALQKLPEEMEGTEKRIKHALKVLSK